MDWQSAPASPSSLTVKRILRLEIPVDTYPNVISAEVQMSFCLLHKHILKADKINI